MDEYGFSGRLKRLRELRGWTRTQLAKLSGCDFGELCRVERGDKEDVTGDMVRRLGQTFQVSTDYLLGMDAYPVQEPYDVVPR